MKKDICKRFVDFKTRHSLSNELIVKMIQEYANSDFDCTRSFYSEKYNVSRSAFYKARDFAVICCLVDNKTFMKLRAKSIANYKSHNPNENADGTIKHHEFLLRQRIIFLSSFSEKDIKDIAKKYVEGIGVSELAMEYGTGKYAIKYLLKKGITSLIVDANTTKLISNIVGSSLEKILQERERNKQLLLDCLQKQIAFLDAQIKCYDLYFRNIAKQPTLESLQKELSKTIRFRKEVLLL